MHYTPRLTTIIHICLPFKYAAIPILSPSLCINLWIPPQLIVVALLVTLLVFDISLGTS